MDYIKLGRKNSKKIPKSSEIFKIFHKFKKNKNFVKSYFQKISKFSKIFKIVQNFQKFEIFKKIQKN